MSCKKTDCVNRGGAYELSGESNCDHCIHSIESWRVDLYQTQEIDTRPQNQCGGCQMGLRIVDGIHRRKDGKPYMVCMAKMY